MQTGAAVGANAATAAVGLAPDLQKRVKIMAEHVARNGPDFEATVKAKNSGNPQFSFLVGGEGAEYYQQLLQAHRAAQLVPPASQVATGTTVDNAEAAELAALAARWREPQVVALGPDGDRQLQEIIGSLEHIASRDAIRAGRTWIEANVTAAHAIAGNLMKRIVYLPTCAHRLHVLFLLHDVLQTEVSKQEPARPLTSAFKPYLVWMLRPSYQLAQSMSPNGEESAKILKLLALWAERGILTVREAEEVKAIVTAKELPAGVGASVSPGAAARATGVAAQPQQIPGLAATAPSLVQQVGAQLGGQQTPAAAAVAARPLTPQGQPSAVLGILQQLPGVTRPPAQLPLPGFTGVVRPALPAVTLPHQGGQTPETVPVGVMATMLKQVSKRGKDLHTAFVPYKPLDPLYTPQTLPPVAPPTARLMERLAEYYDIVGNDAGRDEKVATLALPAPVTTSQVAAQPVIALGNAPAEEPELSPDENHERPLTEEGSATGEKKVRRIMCASGSRSRSRSRSTSEGRALAAAAALAAVAAAEDGAQAMVDSKAAPESGAAPSQGTDASQELRSSQQSSVNGSKMEANDTPEVPKKPVATEKPIQAID